MNKYLIKKCLFNTQQAKKHFPKFFTSLWPGLKYKKNPQLSCASGKAQGQSPRFLQWQELLWWTIRWSWQVEFPHLADQGKNLLPALSSCQGKICPSLTELAVSTRTGHTKPRHQCHQTQCHQGMNAPVHPLHHVGSSGWSFVLQNDGNYFSLQSWLYIIHWRNYVGCAYSSLRLSSRLFKWGFS